MITKPTRNSRPVIGHDDQLIRNFLRALGRKLLKSGARPTRPAVKKARRAELFRVGTRLQPSYAGCCNSPEAGLHRKSRTNGRMGQRDHSGQDRMRHRSNILRVLSVQLWQHARKHLGFFGSRRVVNRRIRKTTRVCLLDLPHRCWRDEYDNLVPPSEAACHHRRDCGIRRQTVKQGESVSSHPLPGSS